MSDPVLYQVHPMCGLLSFSPYCVKVQLALRLKGIAFTTVDTLFPSVNPHNKVPFLVWGERKLEDSTAIIAALDESAGGPKLIPEDPKLRAEAHILEDWADESLYWQGVRVKFVLDDVWARIEPDFKKGFPMWLRLVGPAIARRQTLGKLSQQGLSRRSPELAEQELEGHLDALQTKLDGRSWLVGDAISIADVAVAAMLGQFTKRLSPKHAEAIAKRPALATMMAKVRELAKA
jgi:glutathione S-transferase